MSCPGNNYVVPGADPCAGGGGGGSVNSVGAGTKISITGTPTDPIVNNEGVLNLNTLTGNVSLFSNTLTITPGVPTTDQITIDSTGAPQTVIYTTSGTITAPVGYKFCNIITCGGGGGGAGAQGTVTGGGGSSGASLEYRDIFINGGVSQFVMVIGAGGTAGVSGPSVPPATAGGAGGTTTLTLNGFPFLPSAVGGGGGFMFGVGGSGGDYGGGGGTWGSGSFGAGGTGIKGNGEAGNTVPGLGGYGGFNLRPTTGAGGGGGGNGGYMAFPASLGGGGQGGSPTASAQAGGSGFVAITYFT